MNRTASRKKESSKRSERPTTYRRVVTANVDGKSTLRSDEQLQSYEFKSVPSYEHTLVWVNPTTPDLREEQRFDRYPDSIVPGPGGTSLHVVTFPPGSVFADPSFDVEAARNEAVTRLRGLADHFEKECSAPSLCRGSDRSEIPDSPKEPHSHRHSASWPILDPFQRVSRLRPGPIGPLLLPTAPCRVHRVWR